MGETDGGVTGWLLGDRVMWTNPDETEKKKTKKKKRLWAEVPEPDTIQWSVPEFTERSRHHLRFSLSV